MPGALYALPALAAELVRIPVNVIVTDAMKPIQWSTGMGTGSMAEMQSRDNIGK
jgi:hypothetical protein